jgi:hypothetical protein
MFERFSEHARRAVFWGRDEAALLRSAQVNAEHLLLGLLRGDQRGVSQIREDAAAAIRRQVEQSAPQQDPGVPTIDVPLSDESKQVLVLASKEADALQHMIIDTPHLLLAMLRLEDCTAAKLLRKHGLEYDQYRAALRDERLQEPKSRGITQRPIERPSPWDEAPSLPPAAPSLEPSIRALEDLLDSTAEFLNSYSDSYGDQRLKRRDWTRKEALGHLIDWAMAHQQWFARALTESKLTAAGYPGEAEVAASQYADFSWTLTVDLWVSLNRLLVHVLLRMPEDMLRVPCRIGITEPMTLAQLVAAYVEHSEDMVGQILAHL